MIKSLLIV